MGSEDAFRIARPARRLAIAVALLAGVALRFAWPLADPAEGLSWSGGIWTDPPANTLPARYAVELGDWTRVRIAERLVYPLLNGITWVAGELFGTGRRSTQFLAGLIGLAAAAATAAALRRGPGSTAAALGLILGCVGYWLAMYSRILMTESLVAALLALSCLFAMRRGARDLAAAGGVAAIAVLFGKYHAVGFLPGLALFVVLRDGPRAVGPVVTGSGIVAVAWLFGLFLPHRTEILDWLAESSVGASAFPLRSIGAVALAPFDALRDSWMLHQMPVVAALGALFVIRTFTDRNAFRRRLENGSALFGFWVAAMALYYTVMPYRAPRYFVLVGWPLTAAAACLLAEGLAATTSPEERRRRKRIDLALLPWLVLVSFTLLDAAKHWEARIRDRFFVESLIRSLEPAPSFVGALVEPLSRQVLLSVALALAVFAAIELGRRRLGSWLPRGAGRRLALLGLAAVLATDFAQAAWWMTRRTYSVERASASLATIVGPDAVILGGPAPLVTQGTGRLAVPQFGDWNRAPPLTRHGVTHVLLSAADPEAFEQAFPDVRGRLRFVRWWPVRMAWVRRLELHRVPPDASGTEYVPTAFERAADAVRDRDWKLALERFDEYRRAGGAEGADLFALEADCRFRLGEYEEAGRLLERAIAGRPDDPALWMNLGSLAFRRGDRAAAREAWRRGLELDPSNAELRVVLRRVER